MFKSNIQELENYLSAMAKRTTNMRPVMGMIGEKIVTISKEAFEKEQDPISGKAWSPLSKATLKSKARRGKANNKKLVDSADLKTKSIDYEATNDSVETYASGEYAATHFFGDDSRNIKQRRYMPFTDSLDLGDKIKDELLEDLGDYILGGN
jgi:phage virion morphogenesis protein